MTKIEARDDPEYLRELCRQALHALETPGDFSTEEFFGLMRDLESAGYNEETEDDQD